MQGSRQVGIVHVDAEFEASHLHLATCNETTDRGPVMTSRRGRACEASIVLSYQHYPRQTLAKERREAFGRRRKFDVVVRSLSQSHS